MIETPRGVSGIQPSSSTVSLWICCSPSSLKQVRIAAVMLAGRTTLLMEVQTLFGCILFLKCSLFDLSSLLGCCAYKLILPRPQ
jgi:hypothetical protein